MKIWYHTFRICSVTAHGVITVAQGQKPLHLIETAHDDTPYFLISCKYECIYDKNTNQTYLTINVFSMYNQCTSNVFYLSW